MMLLLIPQRYEFSSKSQQLSEVLPNDMRCCWYHKGTNFQANHNSYLIYWLSVSVVADTTKVRIFKQITTPLYSQSVGTMLLLIPQRYEFSSKSQPVLTTKKILIRCCWYHKGTNFQANHNRSLVLHYPFDVVADTTKVRIFKQITTNIFRQTIPLKLLLIPQRYEFSSKSQPDWTLYVTHCGCCWYHKGTNFQANHNPMQDRQPRRVVVADTTKVRIFKQITTRHGESLAPCVLLLIPQRYEFSSKSQPNAGPTASKSCCCWYHKGTNFQANHNYLACVS